MNPGETREGVRVVLAICTNCGKPLSPESVESGWCHCEPDDFDDLKRTYEAVPYVPASLLTDLAEAATDLADEAARAVTEPRRFYENEDERQQRLSRALTHVRLLLRSHTEEKG